MNDEEVFEDFRQRLQNLGLTVDKNPLSEEEMREIEQDMQTAPTFSSPQEYLEWVKKLD